MIMLVTDKHRRRVMRMNEIMSVKCFELFRAWHPRRPSATGRASRAGSSCFSPVALVSLVSGN